MSNRPKKKREKQGLSPHKGLPARNFSFPTQPPGTGPAFWLPMPKPAEPYSDRGFIAHEFSKQTLVEEEEILTIPLPSFASFRVVLKDIEGCRLSDDGVLLELAAVDGSFEYQCDILHDPSEVKLYSLSIDIDVFESERGKLRLAYLVHIKYDAEEQTLAAIEEHLISEIAPKVSKHDGLALKDSERQEISQIIKQGARLLEKSKPDKPGPRAGDTDTLQEILAVLQRIEEKIGHSSGGAEDRTLDGRLTPGESYTADKGIEEFLDSIPRGLFDNVEWDC